MFIYVAIPAGVLLLNVLNRFFYTGVCVESTILVCHQTQSDCPQLTGNQVTLTSWQMLSENRLVCQETVRSPFKTELSFVCLRTPSQALCHPPSQHLPVGTARGWLEVTTVPSHTRTHDVGGRKHMWLKHGRYCDFSFYFSPRAVFKSHFALQFSVFEAINNKDMSLLASWRPRQLKLLAQDRCINCEFEVTVKSYLVLSPTKEASGTSWSCGLLWLKSFISLWDPLERKLFSSFFLLSCLCV